MLGQYFVTHCSVRAAFVCRGTHYVYTKRWTFLIERVDIFPECWWLTSVDLKITGPGLGASQSMSAVGIQACHTCKKTPHPTDKIMTIDYVCFRATCQNKPLLSGWVIFRHQCSGE